MYYVRQYIDWATFWATFLQTHPVTLIPSRILRAALLGGDLKGISWSCHLLGANKDLSTKDQILGTEKNMSKNLKKKKKKITNPKLG
jgi:hypothetical protein